MNYQECPTMKVCRTCDIEKKEVEFYPRYATCKTCSKVKYKAKQDEYYQNNSKKICKRTNAYYHDNKDRYTALKKEWRQGNKSHEAVTRRVRRQDNLEEARLKEAIDSSGRRAKVKQAFPVWANKSKISEIYRTAQTLNYHVDHVIPLSGKTVCGLHWEANLQVLSPAENHKKSNKFIEDIV